MTLKSLLSHTAVATVVSAFLLAPAFAADCKPAHVFKTIVPGALSVVTMSFPPFDEPQADGTLGGVEGDILNAFAAKECLAVHTVVADASSSIQYVTTGKADLAAASWYRTAARTKVVAISDPLYLDQFAIYSRAGYTKVSELEGKQVGAVQGYNWIGDLQKVFGTNLKLYPNPVAMAQDLESGRIDIGIDSYGTGVYGQKQGKYAGLKIEVGKPDERVRASIQAAQVGFLYTKGNSELGVALNAFIDGLRADGDMAEILKKHDLDPGLAKVGDSRLIE